MLTKKQKTQGKARDIIDAIGHENEKQGIKWAKYFFDEFQKREKEKTNKIIDRLLKVRNKRKEYHRVLREVFDGMIMELERPTPGFSAETGYNDIGIWVKLKDPYGRTFQRGIKPTGTPKIDLAAATHMMGTTEDKMYEISDPDKPTDSGIFTT